LATEDRYAPGTAFTDLCVACRAAELSPPVDATVLDQPFGTFLEEWFLTGEGATTVSSSEEKAVRDLIIEADRALNEYGDESGRKRVSSAGDFLQLADGDVVDRSAFSRETHEQLTSIRRPGGDSFYRHDSPWSGQRAGGTYVSVWIESRPKMLVAKCSSFRPVSCPDGSGGYLAPITRYSQIEEVGLSRMEGIAASLKRSFPPRALPEELGPEKRTAKRRWFH
jgi:hypothetical protein